MLGQVIQICG